MSTTPLQILNCFDHLSGTARNSPGRNTTEFNRLRWSEIDLPGGVVAVGVEENVDASTDLYQYYLPRLVQQWDTDAPSSTHRQIDGTMVFVDISGFTAMSERLARFGKVGAEEVTEVLGECFKGLLAVAYPLGGRLIKFGGDALLLLFDGPLHERRAVNAAVGMQHAIRTLGKVKTSAGNMTLRMSIGAHSGAFHFFLVGDSHRELILTGPAATETVKMEGAAEATEIVISKATASVLPKAAVGRPKEPGFLVRAAVPDVDEGTVDVRPPPGNLEQYIPVAVRESILAGANEPEHRQVTVAFLHFMGVDDLLSEQGPAAVSRALSELIGQVQKAIDPRGVAFLATDVYDDGGKIILAAGAPTATGNDSERMLLALREMVGQDHELPIRIGVNRGHVFSGDVGPAYRRTYTIMGDDVNLAARLMSAASPGEIYATPVVVDGSRTLFATRALEPFSVKGKAEPVQAFEVGEETGTRSTRTREELPFTGRNEELTRLTDALEDARLGSGGVFAIVGDRGIGKTRLLQEAVALESDVPAVTVRAEPYGTASPYRPFRDPIRDLLGVEGGEQQKMVRQLAKAVGRLDKELLPFLPLIGDVTHVDVDSTPEVQDIDPQFRRDRLAGVVIRILELAKPGPLAVILEEGQWMDEASTELAQRLSRATADHSWLVMTTRIGSEGGFEPEDTPIITLGPLESQDALSIVVAATDESPLRPHDIDAIVQRAGGNPLFLEEILTVVRQTESVADLPDSLDALVSAQIDALAPLPKQLLRYASVLGRSFRLTVLNEVLRDDPLELDSSAQDSLVGFLESEGGDRMQFRHGLIRDVAYEGLSYRRRRELHAKAAHATERLAGDDPDSVADLLALHYSLAQEYQPTWHYARIAGDDAREAYANVDAATQYERALEAAGRLRTVSAREKAGVWEALGDVRERVGLYDGAVDAYRRAVRLRADDPIARANLLLKRARARMRSSAYAVALGDTTRGLRSLENLDGHEAAKARAGMISFKAAIRMTQDRPREALANAQEAADLASLTGEDEALARAYGILDWAHLALGEPQKAVHGTESLEISLRIGDLAQAAFIMNNLGGMAYFDGRWDEAVTWYAKSREAFRRAGNDVGAAFAGANTGEVLVSQYRFDEAEPVLREAIRVLRASGSAKEATFAETQLARLLTERGEHDEAHNMLRRIHAEAEALGQTIITLEAALYLARLRVLQGDPGGALGVLESAEEAAGADAVLLASALARTRASALIAIGRIAEARGVVEGGLAEARRQGLDYEEALLLRLATDVARSAGQNAEPNRTNEAEALFERLGIRYPLSDDSEAPSPT
ncbi:MAG: AAA family ATPase [Acidimicrobiia bacterium]|nr:AAA family ATPase [Acidimicrobiia bacterium]